MAEIGIRNAYDASDYACLERCLRELAGVTDVHLDRTRGVAHLSYSLRRHRHKKSNRMPKDSATVATAGRARVQNRTRAIPQPAARTAHLHMTTQRLQVTLIMSTPDMARPWFETCCAVLSCR